MIKAAFFDIDGTLKPFNEAQMRETTVDMLYRLKEKGIKLFIATGRPPVQLPLLGERINAFPWDGYIMMNGQYCMDQDKKLFHKLTIPTKTMKILVPWLKQQDYPCSFMEENSSYEMKFNEHMYSYLKSIGKEDRLSPVEDPIRSYTHDTFQICPYCTVEGDAEFLEHAPGMKSARWSPDFADMIPEDGGKPAGIAKTLEKIGCTREESIAFGDGGNDITMLEYAGIGVAMGNASDEVKKHADYVTADSDQDGILKAFEHFEIL